jgi:hypothetical protein
MVLCHSNARCQELAEFSEELTSFSKSIIDVIIFESSEMAEMKILWKSRCEEAKIENDNDEE